MLELIEPKKPGVSDIQVGNIRLKYGNVIPDGRIIRNRMRSKIGTASSLVESIIAPCAEAAESIIIEILNNEEVARGVSLKRRNHNSNTRYHCPGCSTQKILNYSNFCPHCGSKINWIEKVQGGNAVEKIAVP